MQIRSKILYIISLICCFQTLNATVECSNYTALDFHPNIINEYDDFVPKAQAGRLFSLFSNCLHDERWSDRNTIGLKDSFRFSVNPLVTFSFLHDCYSKEEQKTVFDIAGGDGRVAELALFTGAKVYLLDINEREIQEANTRINKRLPQYLKEQFKAYCIDILATKEGFAELHNNVDAVHVANLLHFFNEEETSQFFKTLNTFLKSGGTVHGQVDTFYGKPKSQSEYLEWLELFKQRCESNSPCPGLFENRNLYTIATLETVFKKHGFEAIDLYYTNPQSSLRIDNPNDELLREKEVVKVNFKFKKK